MKKIIARANELNAQGKLNSKTSSQERGGATHLSLNSEDLEVNQILPPLHAKINLLCNVLELMYLFNARKYFEYEFPLCDGLARRRTPIQKQGIIDEKDELQKNAIKKPLNLKVGQHIIGSGGTR